MPYHYQVMWTVILPPYYMLPSLPNNELVQGAMERTINQEKVSWLPPGALLLPLKCSSELSEAYSYSVRSWDWTIMFNNPQNTYSLILFIFLGLCILSAPITYCSNEFYTSILHYRKIGFNLQKNPQPNITSSDGSNTQFMRWWTIIPYFVFSSLFMISLAFSHDLSFTSFPGWRA